MHLYWEKLWGTRNSEWIWNSWNHCLPHWRGETRAETARREKNVIRASAVENGSTALLGPSAVDFLLTFFFFSYTILTLLSAVQARCKRGGKFRLSALLRQAVKPAVVPFRYRATEGFILRGKILRRIRPVLPRGNYSFQGCTRFWIFW